MVVDNVCSRDADDDPRSSDPSKRANCGIGPEVPDEDDFEGTVTLGNQAPTVTLTGPATVRAKETATFRAQASDADGTISTYLFDFDSDGTYELDSDGKPEASTIFPVARPAHDRRAGARRPGRRGVRRRSTVTSPAPPASRTPGRR